MASLDLQDLESTLHHLTNQLNVSLLSIPDTSLFMTDPGLLDHFNTLWLNAVAGLVLNDQRTDPTVKIDVLKEVVYYATTMLNLGCLFI